MRYITKNGRTQIQKGKKLLRPKQGTATIADREVSKLILTAGNSIITEVWVESTHTTNPRLGKKETTAETQNTSKTTETQEVREATKSTESTPIQIWATSLAGLGKPNPTIQSQILIQITQKEKWMQDITNTK